MHHAVPITVRAKSLIHITVIPLSNHSPALHNGKRRRQIDRSMRCVNVPQEKNRAETWAPDNGLCGSFWVYSSARLVRLDSQNVHRACFFFSPFRSHTCSITTRKEVDTPEYGQKAVREKRVNNAPLWNFQLLPIPNERNKHYPPLAQRRR